MPPSLLGGLFTCNMLTTFEDIHLGKWILRVFFICVIIPCVNPVIVPIIVIVVIVLFIASIFIFMRFNRNIKIMSPVQLSHLMCPNCGLEFDYAWIPMATFTAIKLGKSRLFNCPGCGKPSVFNIVDTWVDPETHHCNIRIGPS
jgi:predicted RNA-binding Zn-ribbon protein involved in translation (DUF1610 family)